MVDSSQILCISNEAKEVHFKLLHNIYLTNCFVAKFLDIDTCNAFCKQDTETIPHLFFNCPVTKRFWDDLGTDFLQSRNITCSFTLKDIICYSCFPQESTLEFVLNFIYAKFYIHKQKFNKSSLCFKHYILELNMFLKSHKLVKNKKNRKLMTYSEPIETYRLMIVNLYFY